MKISFYYKFLEAVLIADGKVNSRNFSDAFGSKRQWASKVFREYKNECPNNLVYKPEGGSSGYHKTSSFEPKFLKTDAVEFLECVSVVFKD